MFIVAWFIIGKNMEWKPVLIRIRMTKHAKAFMMKYYIAIKKMHWCCIVWPIEDMPCCWVSKRKDAKTCITFFYMCKTVVQTPPPTYMYVSIDDQEERLERICTRFLTLLNFWRGKGSAEMRGRGKKR